MKWSYAILVKQTNLVSDIKITFNKNIIFKKKAIKLFFTFPWASTGAFLCNSNLATFILPYLAAKCKGVNPFLVVAVSDAPFSNKTDATWNKLQMKVNYK